MHTPDIVDQSIGPLETQLHHAAQNFNYPPTPNLATNVRQLLAIQRPQPSFAPRRLAWTMLLLFVVGLGLLMAVSPARVVEGLHQGIIRALLLEPRPNSTPLLTMTPGPAVSAEAPRLASPPSLLTTPYPSATPISIRSVEPLEPATRVTLPAQLPSRPDSSF